MALKIAIMGTRGIPANYGGFETFAEELSTRLVGRGHAVTVYCRSNNIQYSDSHYKGVRLVILPTLKFKYFDTVVHTFLSVFHGLRRTFDAVLICNSVNSVFSIIPRLKGQKVAVNVDGLEWQRAKWSKVGKTVYRISEFLATFFPDHVVTDSVTIQKYYQKKFGKGSTFIPYGAPTQKIESDEILKRFGLKNRKYVLYVSRLEPENNAHVVVQAFEKTKTDLNLVVVGDAPYNPKYIDDLKNTKDTRIVFTGYVFGQGYRELQSHAYCYVQATEVGGTHPALLEGMGFGNCILANDVPEHREVLGDAGVYFDARQTENLTTRLQYLLDRPEEVEEYRTLASERARNEYSWEMVTSRYERLFRKMAGA
jgi:glycosyltransferase involved in cell wall biosynthesis